MLIFRASSAPKRPSSNPKGTGERPRVRKYLLTRSVQSNPLHSESRSEPQPHFDGVPELAGRPPVLLDAPALLDKAVLAVEGDRRGVVRPDAQAQLVQPLPAVMHPIASRRLSALLG